jgi:hypothetical protein
MTLDYEEKIKNKMEKKDEWKTEILYGPLAHWQ